MSEKTSEQDPADTQGPETAEHESAQTASATGRADISDEERKEMEEERDRRLDPDNRPDNVEVDNTDREFDPIRGQFTDTEDDPDIGPFNDPSEDT